MLNSKSAASANSATRPFQNIRIELRLHCSQLRYHVVRHFTMAYGAVKSLPRGLIDVRILRISELLQRDILHIICDVAQSAKEATALRSGRLCG